MLEGARALLQPSARSGVPPFMVMDVMAAAERLEAQGRTIVHMEVGQPAAGAPASAIAAVRAALGNGPHGYTAALGIAPLRRRIAQSYAQWHGVEVDPERVVVTTGSSAAFMLAFLALFEAGDCVAVAVPGYPPYRHILSALGCEPVLIETNAATRWALTGDHFDAQEALRLGMVNEVVPHAALMDTARALAKRIALVPEPAVRLNKAITMKGMLAAGLYSGLLMEGTLGALAHSSHNEVRERLHEAQRAHGLKAYLDMRDGPFQPEPMGPRSAKRRQKPV